MTEISNDIITFSIPELFASADEKVICWKGEHYYKACGSFVADLPDGGQTFCLKRVGHPSISHEDYDGRKRTRTPDDAAITHGKQMEDELPS